MAAAMLSANVKDEVANGEDGSLVVAQGTWGLENAILTVFSAFGHEES